MQGKRSPQGSGRAVWMGLLVGMLAIGAVANYAVADSIMHATFVTNSECGGDCFGSTYSLVIDDGGTADTNYHAILTVDTTQYSGSGTHISAVDFKVGSAVSSATLTNAPTGALSWFTVSNAGQAGRECGGSGRGFVTSCDQAPSNLAPVGSVMTWEWDFTTTSDITFGHLGVKYDNAAGNLPGRIVSISTVPEPSATVLLCVALFSLAGLGAWRSRQV